MPGGSWNYLYSKEDLDLVEDNVINDLERVAVRLTKIAYAKAVAKDVKECIALLRLSLRLITEADIKKKALTDILKTLEWWDSCDSSEEDFKNAITTYLGEKNK
jgi:hypothetical protein